MNLRKLIDPEKITDLTDFNSIGIIMGALRPVPVTLFNNAAHNTWNTIDEQYVVFEGYGDSLSEIWM